MAESENKRPRRTPQERAAEMDSKIEKVNEFITELEGKKQAAIADYDAKITAAHERIKTLEAKKQEILSPKPWNVCRGNRRAAQCGNRELNSFETIVVPSRQSRGGTVLLF